MLFVRYYFNFFLHRPQKMLVFHEILREHIEYRDIQLNIVFLAFFLHSKFYLF
jgi:hypothetical protein